MANHSRQNDSPDANNHTERQFQVVLNSPNETMKELPTNPEEEDSLSLDDIEAAYLRALETAEIADSLTEQQFGSAVEEDHPEPESSDENDTRDQKTSTSEEAEHPPESIPNAESETPVSTETQPAVDESEPLEEAQSDEPVVSSEQVVEAMLFVGGPPLPGKKFLEVLGGAHSQQQVEKMLESLNQRYIQQQRPYEIQLIEGGYHLQLRSEFEAVRRRAYGQGPKEVKLAQDALEVLAFVAYQQPVSRAAVIETGKQNSPGLLRQLLRRQLISLTREETDEAEVYRTTPRFLELFGLSSLEDLPQAGTFNFK